MYRSLLVAAVFAVPQFALAQTSADVKFRAGDYGTMVSGKITGHEYFDYRLSAGSGQKMFVEITVTDSNGDGTVYFNILPPGRTDVAIYNGSMDGNSVTISLPKSGTYTIRAYQMGNDEDAGKTSAYNIDLSIQ